jgi:CRISPR-associated protein Cas1
MVEAGRRLEARGDCFLVAEDGADRLLVHASRLDRIEVGPGAVASWEALSLASAFDVLVARVDHWGACHGQWSDRRPPRSRRLLAQAGALANPERKLVLAREFAAGRVANERLLLKGWNRTRKDPEVAEVCVSLDRIATKAMSARDVATARGFEGQGTALYWPLYARAFDKAFGFDGHRRRRPPTDAVNACISYLAALLERDLTVAVERRSLHPDLGALHEPRDDESPSLVFDLMEAFRAPIVEALTGWLASRRAVTAEMFHIVPASEGHAEPVARLEPAARKALIRGYEGWVARPIQSRRTGRKVLWRALFEEEAEALGEHFESGKPFVSYRMDY